MNNKNVKVIDEHNIDRIANIIFAIDLNGSEYVAYCIDRDEVADSLFVSKVLKNLDGTYNMLNIEDDDKLKEIGGIVKSLISDVVVDNNDKFVGVTKTLDNGEVVKFISVSFNKEQNINIPKTFITTIKKELTRIVEKYYDVVSNEVEVANVLTPVSNSETQSVEAPEVVESITNVETPTAAATVVVPEVVQPEPVVATPVAETPVVPTPVEPVVQTVQPEPVLIQPEPVVVAPVAEAPVIPTPVEPVVQTVQPEPVLIQPESVVVAPVVETPVIPTPVEMANKPLEQPQVLPTPAVPVVPGVSQPAEMPKILPTPATPVIDNPAVPKPTEYSAPVAQPEPVLIQPEPVVATPAVETPVIPTPVVSEPIMTTAPAVEQPLVFNATKETNLNAALGEVANANTMPVDNMNAVREFGQETPVVQTVPQPAIAPMVQSPSAVEPKVLVKKAGFANSKFFMVVAIAFFMASCVFLGYEVFNYFQLTGK